MKVLIETTLDGNRDVNRGELWRTMANDDGQKITVLKTTWTNRLTGFFSPPLSQTYLRRTGGICAPESARGRQIRFAGAQGQQNRRAARGRPSRPVNAIRLSGRDRHRVGVAEVRWAVS